jgi:hypothetical protein
VPIVAKDDGFDAPARIAAGMRHIVFENRSREIHEAMFVRLPPGMTANDYAAQVKAGALFPRGARDYSGPGLTSPARVTELWLHLDPGEYVLICWHHPRTSVRAVTVRDTGEQDDPPPKEHVVLRLVDFLFELSGPIKKGTQVIRVETPGPSMHEVDIFLLHPGHVAADVRRWYADDDLGGPAPADALGGVVDSHDISRIVWIRKTFSPGLYMLQCAMPMSPDAEAGTKHLSHADAGMTTTFEVAD